LPKVSGGRFTGTEEVYSLPIEEVQDQINEAVPLKWESLVLTLRKIPWFTKCAGTSFIITALVMGIRNTGLLQPVELVGFDAMMRMRPAEKIDDRILIIEITEEDLAYQSEKGMPPTGSLSDQALNKVLENLRPFKPATIGVDIFRDLSVNRPPSLTQQLQKSDNIFMICQHSDPARNFPGVGSMPGFPQERLGYSDIVEDPDKFVRRSAFQMEQSSSPCEAGNSLSMQLAIHYLTTQKPEIEIKTDPTTSTITIGGKTIPLISRHWGGYQGIENLGYQMIANYRSHKPARSITLRQALEKDFNPSWVKDKIILLGVTAPSVRDYALTPYNLNLNDTQKMAGISLQANLTSQIVAGALDNRPWIYALDSWQDTLLMFIFSNGILSIFKLNCIFKINKKSQLLWMLNSGSMVILSLLLWCICILALAKIGLWFPLVPGQIVILTCYSIYSGKSLVYTQSILKA
jgi:CHASE2 domain-containing sensor protein